MLTPNPIPSWFWQWAAWRLGRNEYVGHGSDPKYRPKAAPEKIPYWAWAKLAVMQGQKPPPPPKPTPNDQALAKARELLAFCRKFDNSYLFGGEHDGSFSDDDPHDLFDCSSSVSYALKKVGLLPGVNEAQVSGWFEQYGQAGRGKYVTVHANDDHVWLEFTLPEGYFRFDTSPHGDGPRGPRVRTHRRFDSGFVHRHPAGL